jgi:uncharacterized protein YbbC (DUF1343 family)
VSEHPPYEGQVCYGLYLAGYAENFSKNEYHFTLQWLTGMHEFFIDSTAFFIPYFEKLAGNDQLRKDILMGLSEQEIRETWADGLTRFMQTRKKYLLYPE